MSRTLFLRIARFMVSGGVVIAAYYAPYYLLTEFCGVWYLVSSVIGSIISSVINFILQKFWTFENKGMATMHLQVIAFIFVSVGYTVANGGMLYILVGKLYMNYLVAQIIVSSILGVVSYPISGWIFRDKTP
jgi:dolichol-phosphate mannosyltransferase